jgi:hypothetical protein
MKKEHIENIRTRLISDAFVMINLAIFKPFGLEMWEWQAYFHILVFFIFGVISFTLVDLFLDYVLRMPRSLDRGVEYVFRRNFCFQCLNAPLTSLMTCLYRHFVMSNLVAENKLSLYNYLETLIIITFLSFCIGFFWRFWYRSRFLEVELAESKKMNEHLKDELASAQEVLQSVEEANAQAPQVKPEIVSNNKIDINISNLLYIEAVGNYVKICTQNALETQTTMFRTTMKQIEDMLKDHPMIVRCHRAFMVNVTQVEHFTFDSRAMQLMLRHCRETIPVSRGNIIKIREMLE